MKNDDVYLRHIVGAIGNIEEYLDGCRYESFASDKKTVDAVVRELEIIGEAANRLSGELVNSHPNIPWRDMVDMRNVLIHEYFGVNTKIVWDTCTTDLPNLKGIIAALLR